MITEAHIWTMTWGLLGLIDVSVGFVVPSVADRIKHGPQPATEESAGATTAERN